MNQNRFHIFNQTVNIRYHVAINLAGAMRQMSLRVLTGKPEALFSKLFCHGWFQTIIESGYLVLWYLGVTAAQILFDENVGQFSTLDIPVVLTQCSDIWTRSIFSSIRTIDSHSSNTALIMYSWGVCCKYNKGSIPALAVMYMIIYLNMTLWSFWYSWWNIQL